MDNGTLETAIGTNNMFCVFICSQNKVSSKEICPLPQWVDKEALQEAYIIAFNRHLTKV